MEKVIFVGVKKDYDKIQSAIKNAETNDIIAIELFTCSKRINIFRGTAICEK